MFLFLIIAPVLASLWLFIAAFPMTERKETRDAVIRGLAISLPLWFLARLFGSFLPEAWGSLLNSFHELFDRVLPYSAFPALGYAVFWNYREKMDRERFQRRLTAFYAAALAPMGLGETTRSLPSPDFHVVIILPFILATIVLALPILIQTWLGAWGWRRVLLVAGYLAGALILSSTEWFMVARNWYLSVLVVAAAFAIAWRAALPGLSAMPRNPA